MHQWEIVDPVAPVPALPGQPAPAVEKREPRSITDRMKVPNGWLYRTRVSGEGPQKHQPPSVAMVFVPDEKDDLFSTMTALPGQPFQGSMA